MKLKDTIEQLEIRQFNHDDDVEFIVDSIKTIVEAARPKDEEHVKQIEEAVVSLLEEIHYDGELCEGDIERGYLTREGKREVELEKLEVIIEEQEKITKKLKNIQTYWIKK